MVKVIIDNQMPTHVAIIMDGSGRWAKSRGLPRLAGHRAGVENMRRLIQYFLEHGLKYLTLYGFSTENWNRPVSEIESLLCLLEETLDNDVRLLHQRGIRFVHLGRLRGLPRELQRKIQQAIKFTEGNSRMTLSLAFNYGGHDEILHAIRHIIKDNIAPDRIDATLFSDYLYTAGLPDIDLVIRTGGEMRFSNFLMWQAANSECYFSSVLWPDFCEEEINKALIAYNRAKAQSQPPIGAPKQETLA